MTQVPSEEKCTIEPSLPKTLHTSAPLEGSTEKATGSPDVAVADRVTVPPTVPEEGGMKLIVWEPLLTDSVAGAVNGAELSKFGSPS